MAPDEDEDLYVHLGCRARSGRWRRLIAVAAGALMAAAVLAGCDSAGATTTPGPGGSADTVVGAGGRTSVAVTGAKNLTIATAGACGATGLETAGPLNATFTTSSGGDIFVFEITVASPGGRVDLSAGAAAGATLSFSDSHGDSWESGTSGASGDVVVAAGLRSGTVDATLVNSADGTTVKVAGNWGCLAR